MNTHFGPLGGQYVAETLMPVLHELEREYLAAKEDPAFQKEFHDLLADYVGRESPLYFAKRLSEHCGGASIYLKRDGISYYDKTQGFSKNTRHGDFMFSSDREQAHFYVDARKHNTIDIKGKTISIDHDGFESAILWSPGEAAGLANSEIRDGWKDFFCLESANARDNIVTIKPGAKHTSVLTISHK